MSGWISTCERLPDDYAVVICKVGQSGSGYVTAGSFDENIGFWVFNEDGEAEPELRHVTHWMPLPEPPAA